MAVVRYEAERMPSKPESGGVVCWRVGVLPCILLRDRSVVVVVACHLVSLCMRLTLGHHPFPSRRHRDRGRAGHDPVYRVVAYGIMLGREMWN